MQGSSTPQARFRVEFDDAAFTEDLDHASPAGRTCAKNERYELANEGLSRDRLKACQTECRDGTRLPGCAKIYIPKPDGTWGMVFQLRINDDNRPYLAYLAFGARHPSGPGALSVYQVADRRVNRD